MLLLTYESTRCDLIQINNSSSQKITDLLGSTDIADTRGPQVPLVGMIVVPLPAQQNQISNLFCVTMTLNFFTTAFPDPLASSLILKSFRTSSFCKKNRINEEQTIIFTKQDQSGFDVTLYLYINIKYSSTRAAKSIVINNYYLCKVQLNTIVPI